MKITNLVFLLLALCIAYQVSAHRNGREDGREDGARSPVRSLSPLRALSPVRSVKKRLSSRRNRNNGDDDDQGYGPPNTRWATQCSEVSCDVATSRRNFHCEQYAPEYPLCYQRIIFGDYAYVCCR